MGRFGIGVRPDRTNLPFYQIAMKKTKTHTQLTSPITCYFSAIYSGGSLFFLVLHHENKSV